MSSTTINLSDLTQNSAPSRPTRRPRGGPKRYGPSPAFEHVKRGIDVAGGVVGLAAMLPLLLVCAAWIKLVDRGPVLYWQWRVGRDGWLFRIYKLRTMRLNAEAGGARFSQRNDDRVLPGCGLMRRMHLDELPQLWNIAAGQMSLIGPRPERPEMVERLRAMLPRIDRRLAARPGLTGLAQVRNGYANDLPGMRKKLAFDLRYLRQRSFFNELRLLCLTFPKIWDRGAC